MQMNESRSVDDTGNVGEANGGQQHHPSCSSEEDYLPNFGSQKQG